MLNYDEDADLIEELHALMAKPQCREMMPNEMEELDREEALRMMFENCRAERKLLDKENRKNLTLRSRQEAYNHWAFADSNGPKLRGEIFKITI